MENELATENSTQEVFLDLNNGEYLQFDMTLPIQILFDDVMNFVSKTDFEDQNLLKCKQKNIDYYFNRCFFSIKYSKMSMFMK